MLYISLYYVITLYSYVKIPLLGTAVLVAGFLITAIREPRSQHLFAKATVIWISIFYTLGFLLLMAAMKYGFWQSQIIVAYRLARYIPDVLMGIYVANRRGGIFTLICVIASVTAFTGLTSLVFNVQFYGAVGEAAVRYRHEMTQRQGLEIDSAFEMMGIGGVNAAAARAYYFALCLGGFLFLWPMLKRFWVVIYIGMLIAMLAGTILSGLTVPLFLVAFAIGLFLLLRINRPTTAIFGIILAFAFSLAVFLSYQYHITAFTKYFDKALTIIGQTVGSSGDISEISRYGLFMTSMKSFLSHPLIGVGGVILVSTGGSTLHMIGSHSGFADTLGQWGLIGSFGYIVLIIYIVILLWRLRPRQNGSPLGSFYFAFVVLFSVFALHSFVNPTIGTHEIMQVFLLAIGMLFGASQNPNPITSLLPAPWARRPRKIPPTGQRFYRR